MIAYFDTSAFFPLIVRESTTLACQALWRSADIIVSVRLLYVECAAALHQARRLERITNRVVNSGLRELDRLWTAISVVEIDDALMREAGHLAGVAALRGYDATHCAAAMLALSEGDVAATGDRRLLTAWQRFGLATFDASAAAPARPTEH